MNLKVQIITLVFSFLYGSFFSFLLTIQYRFIYAKEKWFQYCFTILFVLVMTFLYFLILRKINYGILHPYAFLSMIVGYSIEHLLHLHLLTSKHIVKKKET